MIDLQMLAVGPFMTNAYLVSETTAGRAFLVDPGDQAEDLERMVRQAGVQVNAIVATHAHVDHIGAVADLCRRLDAPFWMHRADDSWRLRLADQARAFGLGDKEIPEVDRYLEDGEQLTLGVHDVAVRHTPGHSPGSISLVLEGQVLAGDTLFSGGVGRTDLPGGSWSVLLESIRTRLLSLPASTRVWPGHGPDTTVETEARSNPFLREGGFTIP